MKKTAIITGATSGFGKETVKKLAKNGYNLIICGRRKERLDVLKKEFPDNILKVASFDMSKKIEIDDFIDSLSSDIKIDVLINNAGLALGLESADEALIEDWQNMISVNINGLIYMTRAVLSKMVKDCDGHIVNISSIAGKYPYPGGNVYGATKAFVSQFSKNLRADLLGKGIRVSDIAPGLSKTEFSEVRFHGDKEKAEAIYEGVLPLKPEDIAEAIFFALSQPKHVNINFIEIMPTCQSFSPLAIYRDN